MRSQRCLVQAGGNLQMQSETLVEQYKRILEKIDTRFLSRFVTILGKGEILRNLDFKGKSELGKEIWDLKFELVHWKGKKIEQLRAKEEDEISKTNNYISNLTVELEKEEEAKQKNINELTFWSRKYPTTTYCSTRRVVSTI